MNVATLRKSAKEQRLEEVVSYCASPRTVAEIQEHCGIVYNTAWRYVNELQADGKIKLVPGLKNGSMLFVAGKPTVIPQLYNMWLGQHISLMYFPEYYDPVERLASSHAVDSLPTLIVMLLREIEASNLQALADIRNDVIKAHGLLASTTAMFEQLLKNNDLWTADGVERIRKDPDFNRAVIAAAYDKYLAYRQSLETGETNG